VRLFEHDVGDAYFAAFSTRQGGVSEGDFESLNLGIVGAFLAGLLLPRSWLRCGIRYVPMRSNNPIRLRFSRSSP